MVFYHGGLDLLSGGYVVDVFFVISGFVITGVLLRERVSSGRTSFLSFYGRRSRRIVPAATFVIVVTVTATYWVLGAIYGDPTATDARWTRSSSPISTSPRWNELPECTTTSVTASELLVTGCRGAVLPRLPGAVYAHCDTAQQLSLRNRLVLASLR